MPAAPTIKIDLSVKPKKIVFDDEGAVVTEESLKKKKKAKPAENGNEINETKIENSDDENDYFAKRENKKLKQQKDVVEDDAQKKWFNVFPEYANDEILDIKDKEQMELYNLCKKSFEEELPTYIKRNPSDARWLQTALHKGTAKDRANAGALLVTSNPLANLEALSTLISTTKLTNKSCVDVIGILTDLWKEVLLPPQRKLVSIHMRGADWKVVRKDTTLTKEKLRRIYAYWYFENELKDHYCEFLKNVQQGMQAGQENNKNHSIVCAANLLAYAPEREQMLLSMLVNKLGDPIAKIASKALYHLTEVAHKHPNMCGVIVADAEKLLFRNNIAERAQHFALCFLSSIATAANADVCTKLVNICFSFFKMLVQKGAINNRTMQAILRCLQKAVLQAKPNKDSDEILSKDMQNTVYRLVHLADIRISVQTLGLLLQLVTLKADKADRFYNALYKKMLDLEVTNIGNKTAAQFLHIIHRAMHADTNLPRVHAYIKRLLQIALYMPAAMAAGCLIVIYKLFRTRKELLSDNESEHGTVVDTMLPKVSASDEELAKFDSDGEEKYEDVQLDESATKSAAEKQNITIDENLEEEEVKPTTTESSWHHAKVQTNAESNKVKVISNTNYDPYYHVPAFAAANLALRQELLLLREHYHPTVQVFADNILNLKRIDYYGDPLKDFSLPHFLERFAFKNPKNIDKQKTDTSTLAQKRYLAYGARGKPVKALTKENCTEDEMFIFNFLEHKRKQTVNVKKSKTDEDESNNKGDVDDDEFEDYLAGFFGKKAKAAALAEKAEEEEELDFLKELGGETKKKKKKSKTSEDVDDVDDIDADWGDEVEGDSADENLSDNASDMSDDEDGSIDLENDDDDGSDDDDDDDENLLDDEGSLSAEDDDDDDMNAFDDEDDDDDSDDSDVKSSKSKKSRKQLPALNEKKFAKTLKESYDMNSLFAAADDFAELLEETGKTKGHGTANALFNKDKSSDKQLKWEEKRHSHTKTKKRGKPMQANKKIAKKRKM